MALNTAMLVGNARVITKINQKKLESNYWLSSM